MAVAASFLKSRGVVFATIALLAGCASAPTARLAEHASAAPAAGGPVLDASYDLHGQVIVPFGTLLKSSPVPMHEVLLFHDDARAADSETKDCYAIDGAAPRLVGQTPNSYLLCFDHDRLERIESTVRLARETASQVFARACAWWQSGAPPAQAAANVCEGHNGATAFIAHLVDEPGEPSLFSLVLSNTGPAP